MSISPLRPLRALATAWLNDADEFEASLQESPWMGGPYEAAVITTRRELAKALQKAVRAVARKLPKPTMRSLTVNTDRDEVAERVTGECNFGRCCSHYLSPGTDVCCWCATSLMQDNSTDHGPYHPEAVPCRVVKS